MRFGLWIVVGCIALIVALLIEGFTDSAVAAWSAMGLVFFVGIARTLFLSGFRGRR